VKIKFKGRKESFSFLKITLLTSKELNLIGRNKGDNKIKEN
jgi:hypothetical protein